MIWREKTIIALSVVACVLLFATVVKAQSGYDYDEELIFDESGVTYQQTYYTEGAQVDDYGHYGSLSVFPIKIIDAEQEDRFYGVTIETGPRHRRHPRTRTPTFWDWVNGWFR